MRGKVTLEEAFNTPEIAAATRDVTASHYIRPDRMNDYEQDVTDMSRRRKYADDNGVGYTICSHTVPGVQGERDPAKAEKMATTVNDWIAGQIKDRRHKMGAFATLSMHNPKQATEELRRCVKDYGFHGALLNNWQLAYTPDGKETILLYDQPEYDVFWSVVQELDVPIYIHPAAPQGVLYDMQYKQRKYLIGPPLSFANDVSIHMMGLITNGVLDRFPKLQLVFGHFGEHIPFDLWRINHWLEDIEKPLGLSKTCKKTIHEYFRENIWITTSGHFSTATLQYCIGQVGADRILFSVDFPYETYDDACQWYDKAEINLTDKVKIGRENAKKLLKLHNYHDSKAPVRG
ncbi:hypothetical protein AJ80_02277 [Polytolypa hystricis UAMH7299]|uniref:Amidohydrolase-related domain-containing protein n=1 Tax=Polytolypa hystricis (strain UAMH7299) TaxID=1447883 RepID=A0A2B7YRI7_POLH7|nr:hypothetical protein AJ80_02277 [Polytolypa hystricis UAMH7299]